MTGTYETKFHGFVHPRQPQQKIYMRMCIGRFSKKIWILRKSDPVGRPESRIFLVRPKTRSAICFSATYQEGSESTEGRRRSGHSVGSSLEKEICSISSRSRVVAHRPCPKLEMFCPSVLQLFYSCSKVRMTNHGMSVLFLFFCFSNRLEIRAQLF